MRDDDPPEMRWRGNPPRLEPVRRYTREPVIPPIPEVEPGGMRWAPCIECWDVATHVECREANIRARERERRARGLVR